MTPCGKYHESCDDATRRAFVLGLLLLLSCCPALSWGQGVPAQAVPDITEEKMSGPGSYDVTEGVCPLSLGNTVGRCNVTRKG